MTGQTEGSDERRIAQEEANWRVPNSVLDGIAPEIVIERGRGRHVWDQGGRRYIDMSGGTTSAVTGHCHETYVTELTAALGRMNNMNQFSVTERLPTYEALGRVLPKQLTVFEFYSSGSEAVEQALRMVRANGGLMRRKVAGFEGSYHGKTEGALRVVTPLFGRKPKPPYLESLALLYPTCHQCPLALSHPSCELACLTENLRRLDEDRFVGGVLFEPVRFDDLCIPPEGFWEGLEKYCRSRNILLVADEISCGVGRVGKFLATELYEIEPDAVLVGRALGSGFPVVVLAGRREVMSAKGYLGLGESYSSCAGTDLALAAVRATLAILREESLLERVREMGAYLEEKLRPLIDDFSFCLEVRGIGAMFGVFVALPEDDPNLEFDALVRRLFEAGLLCQVNGRLQVLYMTPALTMTREEVDEAESVLRDVFLSHQETLNDAV